MTHLGGRGRAARGASAGMVLLAFTVLVALLSGAAVLASPKDPFPQNPAVALLPPEGHREVERDGDDVTVREYAFNPGAPMMSSGPMLLFFAFTDPEAFADTTFLRLLETTVSGDDVSHSVTAMELSDSGVHHNLDVSGQQMQHWVPAPLILPADMEAGSSWRSTGSVNSYEGFQPTGSVRYDFTSSAAIPADPAFAAEGCMDIIRTERIDDTEDTRTETWCPGRGIVAGRPVDDDSAPNPTDPDLGGTVSWDPATWTPEVIDLNKTPPMVWASALAPVGTDEALVMAHRTTGDLLIAPNADVDLAVRAHPGGLIVALANFGDLVVAATTQATVDAYDVHGVWQWSAEVPDIVSLPPALVDGKVVVADSSGGVTALDARTGQQAWSTSLSDQVVSVPVACDSTTLFGTTAADLVVLDANGQHLATAALSDRSEKFACGSAGELYSAGSTWLERIAPDGTVLVRHLMNDSFIDEIHAFDDVVVTASDRAITAYDDQSLELLWRVDGDFFDTAMADQSIIALDTQQITALDLLGNEVAAWPSDAARDGLTSYLVPTAGGVGVVSPDMQYTRLR